MTTKPRVLVLRLFRGDYLSLTGGHSPSLAQAVKFSEAAAATFTTARNYQRNDPLWGASFEYLPKRPRLQPLSEAEMQAFVARLKLVRILAEAERYERLATEYLAQARHAEQMAKTMKEKALAIRQTLLPSHPVRLQASGGSHPGAYHDWLMSDGSVETLTADEAANRAKTGLDPLV